MTAPQIARPRIYFPASAGLRLMRGWLALLGAVLVLIAIVTSAMWSTTVAAQPASQRRTPPPCCVAPAPAQPAGADIRGTTQQPLVVNANLPPKGPAEIDKDERERAQRRLADDRMFLLGAITALILTVQFLAFAVQAHLLRRSIESSEATARRQLRAYVHVEGQSLEPLSVGAHASRTRAHVILRNFGQTPAYGMTITGGATLGKDFKQPAEELTTTGGALGPGGTFELFNNVTLDSPLLAQVQSGVIALFVYGTVRYRDTFGDNHLMTFRVMTGSIVGGKWDELVYALEGNGAD
jgi:hypothetical protein